jgi:hypothetical protein
MNERSYSIAEFLDVNWQNKSPQNREALCSADQVIHGEAGLLSVFPITPFPSAPVVHHSQRKDDYKKHVV